MHTPTNALEVKVELLIRAPAKDVFEAFADPTKITTFWLARSSGRLEAGARVEWDFVVKGAKTTVVVKEVVEAERIVAEWDDGESLAWTFHRRAPAETLLTIVHARIKGSPDEIAAKALESTQGFTLVVCELKALLERGIHLGLMRAKFPDAEYQDGSA